MNQDQKPVYIKNAAGGVQSVSAEDAPALLRNPDWRQATPEEVTAWYDEQGLVYNPEDGTAAPKPKKGRKAPATDEDAS